MEKIKNKTIGKLFGIWVMSFIMDAGITTFHLIQGIGREGNPFVAAVIENVGLAGANFIYIAGLIGAYRLLLIGEKWEAVREILKLAMLFAIIGHFIGFLSWTWKLDYEGATVFVSVISCILLMANGILRKAGIILMGD